MSELITSPLSITPKAARVVTPEADFVCLTTDDERRDFYQCLRQPRWWSDGGKKDLQLGWKQVFRQNNWRCIYCSRDLAANTDAVTESTEEHLVPKSLLEANGVSASMGCNLAPCCVGCNGLKNGFVPASSDPCWENRKDYIRACKRFIAKTRYANFKKYKDEVQAELKRRAER